MAAAAHLLRRNAVAEWRRKSPRTLVRCCERTHFLISPQNRRTNQTRSLAFQLDAFLDGLITTPEAPFSPRSNSTACSEAY
jgi:hypothetical protein